MGLPIPSDTYEILASLSKEEKIQVIAWMAKSLVAEQEAEENVDAELGTIRYPPAATPEERDRAFDELNGAWAGSDTAEKMVEEIYEGRTTDDRAHLFEHE